MRRVCRGVAGNAQKNFSQRCRSFRIISSRRGWRWYRPQFSGDWIDETLDGSNHYRGAESGARWLRLRQQVRQQHIDVNVDVNVDVDIDCGVVRNQHCAGDRRQVQHRRLRQRQPHHGNADSSRRSRPQRRPAGTRRVGRSTRTPARPTAASSWRSPQIRPIRPPFRRCSPSSRVTSTRPRSSSTPPASCRICPDIRAPATDTPSTLGGFQAWQLGGTYQRDGKTRAIAQKTVVIPSQGAVYVLQLNADSLRKRSGPADGRHQRHRRPNDHHHLTSGSRSAPRGRPRPAAAPSRNPDGLRVEPWQNSRTR